MLPQIRPVLVAITLLLLIWGMNAITIIYTITSGGPANRTPDHCRSRFSASAFELVPAQPGGGAVGDVLRVHHRLCRDLHHGLFAQSPEERAS